MRRRRIVGKHGVVVDEPTQDTDSCSQELPSTVPTSLGDSVVLGSESFSASGAHGAENQSLETTLVTNFTHQIVNPLNGVVGTLDNLIDGSTPLAKRDQKLRACRAQLQVAIELVRNLAYLSELSTQEGRAGLAKKATNVSLPGVLMEAIQTMQGSAQQKGMTIHYDDPKRQYMVLGHADLLRQVFLNIIENGVKYGSPNTRILIAVRIQSVTNMLLVETTSTGCAVASEDRERIFDRGVRGKEARDKVASGSGIGLYICREILRLYSATVECESSEAKNSTLFRVRFPGATEDRDATERMKNEQRNKSRDSC